MDLKLNGKVAIITGGSDGIGKAAAASMVSEGAKVTICARRVGLLEETAQLIRDNTGGEVLAISADMTEPSDIKNVIDKTVEKFGGIDIVVNNAGQSAAGSFETVSDDAWEADMDLKFYAAIRMSRAAIPYMKQSGGGRIINVTNLGGKAPAASSMPTSVSRAAGIALTKAMSKDLAADNILVNTVCIGLIKSGQHERRFKALVESGQNITLEGHYEQLGGNGRVPLGRVGEAEEAGDVITFLASGPASFLTGCAINIDGGASAVI